jgi:hypothetical protein
VKGVLVKAARWRDVAWCGVVWCGVVWWVGGRLEGVTALAKKRAHKPVDWFVIQTRPVLRVIPKFQHGGDDALPPHDVTHKHHFNPGACKNKREGGVGVACKGVG